jgi:hypothetical protein
MKLLACLLSSFASLRSLLRSSTRFAVLAVSLCSAVILNSSFAARPNVILIMVDDFGYECVTANGGESYQTPNLDKLAATGVRFRATATCSRSARPRECSS